MRPKNCMTCGGNTKIYQGGGCFDAMGNSIPCNGTQLQGSSGANWQNSQMPQQAPVNPALQGADPALTTKIDEQGQASPYQVNPIHQKNNGEWAIDKNKKDPYAIMQRFGIGMRGARTALGWIAGAIERGRQNQEDWRNQTALGLPNPMPTDDFQPTRNNMYGQMGGTNPFSAYAKYGGNLNTIMKEHMKFSNNAQFDFGSGDDDKGKMQGGGFPAGSIPLPKKGDKSFVTYPGDSLTRDQLINAKLQYFENMGTYPNDNQASFKAIGRRDFKNLPVIAGGEDESGQPYYYQPSQKDSTKIHNLNIPFTRDLKQLFGIGSVDNLPNPQTYTPEQKAAMASQFSASGKKMKKGGYEIDRMLVVRKLLPELFMMGRMGKHRWGSKYQQGGLNLSGYGSQDDLAAFPNLINGIAKAKGVSKDEAKALYAQWQSNPGTVQPLSQSVPMLMQAQGKTNYSISYPAPNGQGQLNKYYNTLDDWNAGMQGKQYSSQQVSGDKSSASASIYGQLKKGGIHIKKENKGKFTDYCGGKVTDDCIQQGLNSPSATIRKRANFARNARKWNK